MSIREAEALVVGTDLDGPASTLGTAASVEDHRPGQIHRAREHVVGPNGREWPRAYDPIGTYPHARGNAMSDEIQGITHDAGHWYLSQAGYPPYGIRDAQICGVSP